MTQQRILATHNSTGPALRMSIMHNQGRLILQGVCDSSKIHTKQEAEG